MKKMASKRIPTSIWILIFVLFFGVSAIIVLLLQTNGHTNISNSSAEVKNTQSISCDSVKVSYPFFEYDNSKRKELIINIITKDSELESISLRYILYYDTAKQAIDSENINHVAISKNFVDDSLEYDSFRSKYSRANDSLQYSIYADKDEINTVSSKYFLLDGLPINKLTEKNLTENFNKKGLDCVTRNL